MKTPISTARIDQGLTTAGSEAGILNVVDLSLPLGKEIGRYRLYILDSLVNRVRPFGAGIKIIFESTVNGL